MAISPSLALYSKGEQSVDFSRAWRDVESVSRASRSRNLYRGWRANSRESSRANRIPARSEREKEHITLINLRDTIRLVIKIPRRASRTEEDTFADFFSFFFPPDIVTRVERFEGVSLGRYMISSVTRKFQFQRGIFAG